MQQKNIDLKNFEESIIRSISWKQEKKEEDGNNQMDLEDFYYSEATDIWQYENDIFYWFEDVFFAREIWADYMEQRDIYKEAGKYWKDYFVSLRMSYRLSTSLLNKDR